MWNKLCRACLKTKESFTYFLFKNVSPETYLFCTSVEVSEEEELPKALCNSCYELLIRHWEFKQTCIQSQNTLLSQNFTLKKTEPESDTEIKADDENSNFKLLEYVKEEDNEYNDDFAITDDFDNDTLEQKIKIHEDDDTVQKIKIHKSKTLDIQKQYKEKFKVHSKRGKLMYTCELCLKRFGNHSRYEAHRLEHDGKKMRYQCQACTKSFASSSGLLRHTKSLHTVVSLKRLMCGTCGRVTGNKETLRAHQRMHEPRPLLVCHVCGQRTTSSVALKKHMETHTTTREQRYACTQCGKKYFTKAKLSSHAFRQHNPRRFICDLCNYQFKEKYNLVKHIRIHEGKKAFQCDICLKKFTTGSSLNEHKRTHSGEKPFGCSYCPKSFLSKRTLRDHHRIHTGEKPNKCGICEQRFTQRGTLQRHMKVHK